MKIDLHLHSNRSDGMHPPREVVRMAREAGLDIIALTDHDTTGGLAEAREAAAPLGLEVLTGCEISAKHRGNSVHMLAYLFDPEHPPLARVLSLVLDDRIERAKAMVEKLQALGVAVTYERVREIAQGESVARPHVAQAMVEAGVINGTVDAFTEEWIGAGGRAYVEKFAPDPKDVVRLVKDAGGVTAVAHPIWLTRDGAGDDSLIEDLAGEGLDALEVDHPDHDETAREHFGALARRLGLVPTGSSDWHGNEHGGLIGECLTSPDALERLRERARS